MTDELTKYKGTFSEILIVSISAIAISAIFAITIADNSIGTILFFTSIGLFFISIFFITIGILNLSNSSVKKTYGKGFIYGSVVHGFMLLFPFAVILITTEIFLKWNVSQTIIAAAILTSVSASTSDLIKLGGNKAGNIIVSLVSGIIFILVFIAIANIKAFV